MKIEQYIKKGNSFPIIVSREGKQFFVKLRSGMSGKYALMNEWIGNKIGQQIGVKTQTPTWIELNSEIRAEGLHIEVKELVNKSLGLNIGFEFKPDAREVKKEDLAELNKQELAEIFLLDLVMINIDRTATNFNLMKSGGNLFSVDYESSLLVSGILENKNLLRNSRILQSLRNNPLYQSVDQSAMEEFLDKTQKIVIGEIISEIPRSILDAQSCDWLIREMEGKRRIGWALKPLLNELNQLKSETREEQKERFRRNQAAFKKKLGTNLLPNQSSSQSKS